MIYVGALDSPLILFKKDEILATRLLLDKKKKKSLFSCFEISNLVEIFYNSHFGSLFNFHYIYTFTSK